MPRQSARIAGQNVDREFQQALAAALQRSPRRRHARVEAQAPAPEVEAPIVPAPEVEAPIVLAPVELPAPVAPVVPVVAAPAPVNAQQDLIAQLEGFLSENIPFVAKSIADGTKSVFSQHPTLTFNQAAQYLNETVPPMVQNVKGLTRTAYENATLHNLRNGVSKGTELVKDTAKFIQNHPYTSSLAGVSAVGACFAPLASLAIGAGVVAKTIYKHGKTKLGFDSELAQVDVNVRVGRRNP